MKNHTPTLAHSHIPGLHKYRWYFYLLFIAIIQVTTFSSCNLASKETDNSQYFDGIMTRVHDLYDVRHPETVINLVDSAYGHYPLVNSRDLCRKYIWKGYVYRIIGNFSKGLTCIDSAFELMDEQPEKYKEDYPEALFIKGNLLLGLNEYDKSFQQFYKAKLFVQQYLDTCAYARFAGSLASVSFIQRKYGQAIGYMQEQYSYQGHCDSNNFYRAFGERQGCLDNIGVCYENMGKYDTAVIYYNKALEFIALNEHKYPNEKKIIGVCRAVVLGNLGGVYVKKGSLKEAEELLKENIRINVGNEDGDQDARFTKMKLSHLYIKEGRFDEAIALIKDTRRAMDTMPYNTDEEQRWHKLASDYYDTTGNKDQAYAHYKKYIAVRDSADAKQKELPGADFNKTFDHMNQEVQIASLKKEKNYANRYLFISVILSVMAVVIIYLVWNNYRQSKSNLQRMKKLNKQISSHNLTMQKTLNALEQSQQNNTRMMRVVAHDLHNPVSAMVSLIDLLSDGDYDEEQKEMFQMLAQSGTNALKLIGDILHTKPAMEMERLRLDELLTYSVGLMQYRANEKKQALVLKVEPITVVVDREKIWRVINNLIVNAIKFSYEGKKIDIALVNKGDVAVLSVKDEGVGMSSILSGQIFQHFALGGRTGTSGEESFGLGLSISKQIIDAHGGRIWFESAVGKGTTFYVELKSASPEAE